jgi:hypothetical protein
MIAAKPGGTREQQAVGDWLDGAAAVRSRLAATAEQVPEILPYFDCLTDAVASLGLCELHGRSLDRSIAVDVFTERRKWLGAEVARHNDAGIASIERTRATLGPLHEALGKLKLPKRQLTARLDEAAKEFRVGVADWDMKGSDAAALVQRFDAIAAVARKSGLAAITEHIDKTLAELVEVRRRPDRGVVENFPFWKLLILVALIGWWIVFLVVCTVFGCSPAAVGFWTIINISHLFFFVLFC